MKKLVAAVLTVGVLTPTFAFAGGSTDAALGLGAFAVFNQILSGTGIFGGLGGGPVAAPPVVYAPPPPPVIYAPPPAVYAPPPVVYVPRPVVVVQPRPVYVAPRPVYVAPRPPVVITYPRGHRYHTMPVYQQPGPRRIEQGGRGPGYDRYGRR